MKIKVLPIQDSASLKRKHREVADSESEGDSDQEFDWDGDEAALDNPDLLGWPLHDTEERVFPDPRGVDVAPSFPK